MWLIPFAAIDHDFYWLEPRCKGADIAIIGGGIAGASAAYELAATSSVVLIERESHLRLSFDLLVGLHCVTENDGTALHPAAGDCEPILSRGRRPKGFCDRPA